MNIGKCTASQDALTSTQRAIALSSKNRIKRSLKKRAVQKVKSKPPKTNEERILEIQCRNRQLEENRREVAFQAAHDAQISEKWVQKMLALEMGARSAWQSQVRKIYRANRGFSLTLQRRIKVAQNYLWANSSERDAWMGTTDSYLKIECFIRHIQVLSILVEGVIRSRGGYQLFSSLIRSLYKFDASFFSHCGLRDEDYVRFFDGEYSGYWEISNGRDEDEFFEDDEEAEKAEETSKQKSEKNEALQANRRSKNPEMTPFIASAPIGDGCGSDNMGTLSAFDFSNVEQWNDSDEVPVPHFMEDFPGNVKARKWRTLSDYLANFK